MLTPPAKTGTETSSSFPGWHFCRKSAALYTISSFHMCYERFRNKCKDAWCEMPIWELYKDIQVFLHITKSENVGPDVSQALKRSKRLWIWAQVYIWSCFRSTCSVFKNLGLRRDSEGALVRWRKGKAKQSKCPLSTHIPKAWPTSALDVLYFTTHWPRIQLTLRRKSGLLDRRALRLWRAISPRLRRGMHICETTNHDTN